MNAPDENLQTPLHLAAYHNRDNPAVLAALLEAGANVAAHNERGLTPLHIVVRNLDATLPSSAPTHTSDNKENLIATVMLLRAGADVVARDLQDRTPLHIAAELNSNPDIAATLLNHGADVALLDVDRRGNGGEGEIDDEVVAA